MRAIHNKELQLVLSAIHLSILFYKISSSPVKIKSSKKDPFGFTKSDLLEVVTSIAKGINITKKIEPFIASDGVSFLKNSESKAKFIEQLKQSKEGKCLILQD